jgi:hypothetical protein
MHTLIIPKQYQRTGAVRARYIQGWKDAHVGRKHAYPKGKSANAFQRENGPLQLESYSAGYEAAVSAMSDNAG